MKKQFGKLLGRLNNGRRQRSSSGRRLQLESLEGRRLLAADLSAHHNYFIAEDVNMDFAITPMDALLVINALNQGGARSFGEGETGDQLPSMLDVNGDKMLTPMDALLVINRLNGEGEDPVVPYVAFSYNITNTSGVPIVGNNVTVGQTFRINVSVQDVRPDSARSITDPNDPSYNLVNGVFTASQDLGVSDLNVVSYVQPTSFFSGIKFDPEFFVGREGGQGGGIRIGGVLKPGVSDGQYFSITTASGGTKTFEFDITGTPAVTDGRVPIPLPSSVNFQPMVNAMITAIQGAGLGLTPVDRGYQTIGLPTDQFTFDPGNSELNLAIPPGDPRYPEYLLTLSTPQEDYLNEIRATVDRSRSIDPVGPVAFYSVDFKATAAGSVTFTPNKPELKSSETSVFGGQAPIPSELIDYGASFIINVLADPTAPVAVNDTLSTPEDTALVLGANVTANDTVTPGRTLSIDSISKIAGVTVGSVSGTTYTPPADFFGQDKLTYVVKDSTGLKSSMATITINVTPVNDAPTAFNDLFSVDEGSTANSLNLLADNGSGADIAGPANETSDSITITRVGPVSGGGTTFTTANGSVVTIATGGKTVNYVPTPTFNGIDTFVYTITDSGGLTASATVTVDVAPATLPRARGDSATGPEGGPLTIAVLSNDSTNDGATGVVKSFTNGANGSVARKSSDSGSADYHVLVYTSTDPHFYGSDTFVYVINDTAATGPDSTATVTVTITGVNDPPVLTNDTASTNEDTALTIPLATLLSNDSPGPGEATYPPVQTLKINSVAAVTANAGTVQIVGTNVVYTPATDFNGQFLFTYVAQDNGTPALSATATVTVTVTPVNDPPIANPDTFSGIEDTTLNIPAGGTPIAAGDVRFNDRPGPATATDEANQTLTVTGVSAASTKGGAVSITAGVISYTPAVDFNGSDTFTYTLSDGAGGTATGTVTVNVAAVNDPPIANPDTVSGTEDTTLNIPAGGTPIVAGDVRFNDKPGPATATDEANQTLTVTGVSAASTKGGTVSLAAGVISYTPAVNFNGTDTFTYTLSDGAGGTATGTVTVNVAAVNDAPTAFNDLFSVDEDSTANSLDLLADNGSGADKAGPANETSDSITITRVGPVSGGGTTFTTANGGVVTIATGGKTVNYVPAPTFVGIDTFVYTITDSGGLTASATVTVDVAPATLPRARGDSATGPEGGPLSIAVLTNDSINDGATGIVKSFTNGANGTVARKSSDSATTDYHVLVYTSTDPHFYGSDTFTYLINDTAAIGPDSTATVTVTITDVNDPPVLTNDTASTSEDTALTIPITTLLSNDSPGPGEATYTPVQTLKINSVAAVTANAGTVQIVGTNVVYTPATDFNGQFLFTYVAQDNGTPALSATATVTVSVAAVNDPPIANPDTFSGIEDTTLNIPAGGTPIAAGDVRFNDKPGPATATDEASQTLTVTGVSAASTKGGTVSFAAGVISYKPAPDFNGSDTFTYTLSDGAGGTATGTVTVNVAAVNDPPVAGADSVNGFRNMPISLTAASLMANDNPGGGIYEASQTLSITAVSATADTHGSVVLASDGTITYTPDAGFTGAASFVYTLRDSEGATSTGTVSVNVQEFVPSTIQGTVYSDNDGDEFIDSTERGLGGIKVTLTGQAADGSALPSQSRLTLADGSYSFKGLGPGNYTVSFTPPTFLIDAPGPNSRSNILVSNPAGTTISNQNFTLQGNFDLSHVANGAAYQMIIDQFASSRYPVNGPSTQGTDLQNVLGAYYALGADNSLLWSALRNIPTTVAGEVEFTELVLARNGNDMEAYLTVVDVNHTVTTRTLSMARKEFYIIEDSNGAKLIGVRGAPTDYQTIDRAAPPITADKYLDSVDQVFAEQGWN